jgi:hypothetical protein
MGHSEYDPGFRERKPWNAGRKLGAKRALKPQQVWAIRFWLDRERRVRDRAMFDLAIEWVTGIGLRREDYGTHSLRRTKASIIYKQTGNLRAVQILLGHTKIESTVRYLGVDIEDASPYQREPRSEKRGSRHQRRRAPNPTGQNAPESVIEADYDLA